MSLIKENFDKLKKISNQKKIEKKLDEKTVIQIGSSTCEIAAGSNKTKEKLLKLIKDNNINNILIKEVGCTGRCSLEPILSIKQNNHSLFSYKNVDEKIVEEIFISHILKNKPIEKYFLSTELEKETEEKKEKTFSQKELKQHPITKDFFEIYGNIPFYSKQSRIALRNSALINPLDIYEYINHQGFLALYNVLEKNDPSWTIEETVKSNLRGRGGAGFPTGKKWKYIQNQKEKTRYMICNADEGDPGAFMDRSMLESDPFSIIEGMIIAGFAIEATKGFFYIRAEYPLAVKRIEEALKIAKENNLLGENILGSNFSFDIEIRLGAGAFVCGEETALIHSIEGLRGQPRVRPPFPAEKGLFGKPTIINNVETLANLPVIFAIGADEFKKIGTEKSSGTKVFAVSGKVNHTGLVEVPMGTSLKTIVFDICSGISDGKKIKAVLTGGPAGGCIPLNLMETKVDYEDLQKLGSIMGSGGLIVLDEDDCMVALARYFMAFSQDESCGKCTPCREGTVRMLEILDKIINGEGELQDLDKLKRLGKLMQRASLCGLGRACANPVLSTLKYFENEYITHIKDKKCPTKSCKVLTHS